MIKRERILPDTIKYENMLSAVSVITNLYNYMKATVLLLQRWFLSHKSFSGNKHKSPPIS